MMSGNELSLVNAAQPDSIPVRTLQNYAYCPRLMYFQFVEKIFIDNADTVAGNTIHSRVNTPSTGDYPEDIVSVDKIAYRSLALESKSLGIHGIIDLVEQENGIVSILDYKRGNPRILPDGELAAKDYDAVQIGAYAMLMQDNGYKIDKAFIYYASAKKRIQVKLEDILFDRIKNIIDQVRKTVAGPMPDPLIEDSRCLYCSLYPVCLPGESRCWKHQSKPGKILLPPDAEDISGETIIIQDPRSYLSKKNDTFVISIEGKTVSVHPFRCVRYILLFGYIQFSTQVLMTCLENDIIISLFSSAGRYIGRLDGGTISGLDSRYGQYKTAENEQISVSIARTMIEAKIANQRTFLMRNAISSNKHILSQLSLCRKKASQALTREGLNGIEGKAAALYFASFPSMIRNPEFQNIFLERNRRPPRDPINAMLSLGYSMLAAEITGICDSNGLDPACGLLHVPRYGRPALALDLMEEFRPLIVDSIVISLINRKEINLSHFISASTGCTLNNQGRKIFWNAYFRRMNTEIRHPSFKYSLSYRRMLIIQVRQLWRIFRGDAIHYEPLMPR